MEALPSESEAYFVELHEYPIEEVFARLKASEELVREAIVGLVSQGLASTQSRPSPVANRPNTLVTFSFVGIVSYKSLVLRCLPKFFEREECCGPALERVIKAIFRQRSSDISPNSQHDESLDSMQGAMDEAVFFVADYLQNGEYPANPIVKESASLGEIDWERTIAEKTPWLLGEALVYLDPVHTYAEANDGDFCQQLHLAIVSDCFRFLKSTGIAEVIGIGSWPPSETKLSDFGNPDYLLSRLRSEKQVQFDDRRLRLLELMERHLERSMSLRSFESFGFFGTAHFEIVWETLCSHAFSNQRDLPINRCLSHAVLSGRASQLSTNSTMKDLIERPTWRIEDGTLSFEQESAGKLNPDVVTVHHENGDCLAILDAKYYALKIGHNTVSNQPGVEDIVKQHAYQMALQEFAKANGLTIQNALLFPTNGETRVIGEVSYDMLSHFTNGHLIPISVVLVNMNDVIGFYLGTDMRWTSVARGVLAGL